MGERHKNDDKTIRLFRDDYRFLSNFHMHMFFYGRYRCASAEHIYQAMKARLERDKQRILRLGTPKLAKIAGQYTNLKCRMDWGEVKVDIMYGILRAKFKIPVLRKKLIDTFPKKLIEENWWHDNFWGRCTCSKCKNKGKNMLGKLLMKVRDKVMKVKKKKKVKRRKNGEGKN